MPLVTGFHKDPFAKKEQTLTIPAAGKISIISNNSRYTITGLLSINVCKCVKSATVQTDMMSNRIVPTTNKAPIKDLFLSNLFVIRQDGWWVSGSRGGRMTHRCP